MLIKDKLNIEKNYTQLSFNQIRLKDYCDIYSEKENVLVPTKKMLKAGLIVLANFRHTPLDKVVYNFVGICIANRNNLISSTIILRNVIELYPLEYTFNIHSPLVTFTILDFKRLVLYNRRKYYFLRLKPAPLSKIKFVYV